MTHDFKQDTNDSDPADLRPLGNLTHALTEASSFYRRKDGNDPTYRETTGWDDPSTLACRKILDTACTDKLVDVVCVNGICWRRGIAPDHRWMHVNVTPDPYGGRRSHSHTTFSLADSEVHIDSIRQSTSGPGAGVHDLQFFVDGRFVSRGGYAFTVPARIPRGEPAAMCWKNHLLICKNNIQYLHDPHPSWLFHWERVDEVS